jgi:adenine-specific DNA-methyltransferase
VMDEVLGADNFCGLITFTKTSSATSDILAGTSDYLVQPSGSFDSTARGEF